MKSNLKPGYPVDSEEIRYRIIIPPSIDIDVVVAIPEPVSCAYHSSASDVYPLNFFINVATFKPCVLDVFVYAVLYT